MTAVGFALAVAVIVELAAVVTGLLLGAAFPMWVGFSDVADIVRGSLGAPLSADGTAGRLMRHWTLFLVCAAVAAVVLVVGTSFMILELRRILQRNASMEIGIRAARGEMQAVIDKYFAEWRLSDAERDVALLLLKGLDNETIASIRGTATGTVRAQCAGIYAKAGVDGRSQLMSVFMEELLSEPLGALRDGAAAEAA